MKNRTIIISLALVVSMFMSSDGGYGKNLLSIFNNQEGEYEGTVNGVLFLKRGCGQDALNSRNVHTILDFQCGSARLEVIHEKDEIYDSHTESFIGYTTSGKSTVNYSTYANANKLQIKIGDDLYEVSTIDGACDSKIPGIEATYHVEKNKEYLVLRFSCKVILDNIQPLLRFSVKTERLVIKKCSRLGKIGNGPAFNRNQSWFT